ncbi:DUF3709 domain-containing protein [Yersinia ruckeri]
MNYHCGCKSKHFHCLIELICVCIISTAAY